MMRFQKGDFFKGDRSDKGIEFSHFDGPYVVGFDHQYGCSYRTSKHDFLRCINHNGYRNVTQCGEFPDVEGDENV